MRARSEPLVSVILPTYNRPSMLADAVRSVERQTYGNIELIVVDDHSPEPVEPLLEDIDTNTVTSIRCPRHKENRGANAARNTGINVANGEFLAFLDDDDVWLPKKIERQVERFQRTSDDVGVVYTGQRFVDEDGITTSVRTPTTQGDVTEQLLTGAPLGPFSTIMVRSTFVSMAGELDERLPSWQDREWCIRLSQHCEFEGIAEPLLLRRIHRESQISDDFVAKRDTSYPLLLKKYRDIAAELGPRIERQFVASLSASLALAGIQNEHYRDAVQYLLKAIRHSPTNVRLYFYLLLATGGKYLCKPTKRLKRYINRLADVTPMTSTDTDHYLEETPLTSREQAE